MQGGIRDFLTITDNDCMGAWDIFGVEPNIPSAGFFEGELVVLHVIASDQNGEAIVRQVTFGFELEFLSFFRSISFMAEVTLFGKLGSDGGQFVVGLCTGECVKDRVDIDGFLLTLCDQLAQFLFGGIGFAIFPVILLRVLCRCL